jgi:hypothetical protein
MSPITVVLPLVMFEKENPTRILALASVAALRSAAVKRIFFMMLLQLGVVGDGGYRHPPPLL